MDFLSFHITYYAPLYWKVLWKGTFISEVMHPAELWHTGGLLEDTEQTLNHEIHLFVGTMM